jgi:hypothetical protein
VGRWQLVQRQRVTEARGGGAPTRPHRGGVAAWRGGVWAALQGRGGGVPWRENGELPDLGKNLGERLRVIRGRGCEPK